VGRKSKKVKNNNNRRLIGIDNRNKQLKQVLPITPTQSEVFESFADGDHLFLHGVAGTGKTFISLYLALEEIMHQDSTYREVQIIRSVVPTRDMGFLPGSEKQKMEAYEAPYKGIVNELFNNGTAYETMRQTKIINFNSTSFIRGQTFYDSIVIVDECQNMNFHELDSVITRLGENCLLIFCGDFRQSDFRGNVEKNGILNFMKIIKNMNQFSFIEFSESDIVRSQLVKSYIINKLELGIA
jgi:phosphate starvation-inducible PhoH-like protein|tara:strand:+ start:98 stop:820 length:723 start_codon:yes stop_codon:yes gene_type:complete